MHTGALLVVDVQKEYIERYENDLLKRINQRIEKAIADSEIIIYIENIKILRHQKLVERILQTDVSEEKIALILNEVHSLADLLDILSDTELYAEDFDLLINMLPLPAFAILLSQYPNDDFGDRESEQLLFAALQKRKQRLSAREKLQIEQIVNARQRVEM